MTADINRTPPRTSGWNWSASSLPAEVLAGSCKRVGAVALAFAGFWLFALLMNNVVARLLDIDIVMLEGPKSVAISNTLIVVGLGLSLAMALVARSLQLRRTQLLDIGLGYLVLTALCVSLVTHWDMHPNQMGISWVAFVIVVYFSIVPNTPLKVLAAGFVAATADPLSFLFASIRGAPVPYNTFELAWQIAPNYLAALVAVVPAAIIRGLGRQVREARELGSYKLGDLLGKGGMGEVYRAEHRLLARPAAVKLIRPELLDPDQADALIERFRREAHAVATLTSPHTVNLYDFGVAADGTFYFVMELLDGIDAEHLITGFGALPPERVAHLVAQAAASIGEAHARGLVHRDIKPSNVFVARLGLEVDFVKMLDFGLVTAREGPERVRLTAPNTVPGTPNVMAPEVALGESAPDARSDVYALGCLAFWLLTGKPVFEGDTAIQVMLRHVRDQPRAPSTLSTFPEAGKLDPIVLRCLAKDPDGRPRDAGELRALLEALEFERPWTEDRAQCWWAASLPGDGVAPGPCDKGELQPVSSAEAEAISTG